MARAGRAALRMARAGRAALQGTRTRGGRRGAALALLCVAQFVDVLGVTIVIVALPAIGHDLGLAERDLQWVASIYALCFGGLLLLAGRAADLYGRRRLFAVGLALFTLASLVCGLAGSAAVLLPARALQGLGAAVAVPAALSLLTTAFPEEPGRARALGVWTAAAAGGGVTGFFLGGVLTGTLGWHWVFWVNLPVGALGLALTPVLLAESRDRAAARRLDVAGAVTGTAGLVLLVYGFTQAEQAGFASAATLGTLALAAALLAGFWLLEGRVADPVVPHRVLRSRELVGANLAAFTLTAVTSPAGVLGTLYLQEALGYPPTVTGLALLPFSLAAIAGSFAGARLTARLRARATMALGLVTVSAAMLLLSRLPTQGHGGLPWLVAGLVIAGSGLTCASVAATASGTAAAAGDAQGLASGLLNTAAQIGTAVGIAALVTIAAARTTALTGTGDPTPAQLVDGFRLAFLAAALAALLGALGILLLVRRDPDGRAAGRSPAGRGAG
jgi:EmrB/QacA subfamily drug resistance transporter